MHIDEPLSNERLIELAGQAFEKNEIAEFLCGEKEYSNPIDKWTPADVPTDIGRSIKQGIHKYYLSNQNDEVIKSYIAGIYLMMQKHEGGHDLWKY